MSVPSLGKEVITVEAKPSYQVHFMIYAVVVELDSGFEKSNKTVGHNLKPNRNEF